jgi:hypothetical protein
MIIILYFGLILGPALGGFLAQVILLLVISCKEMHLKIPLGVHVLMRGNAFKNIFCGGCHTPRTRYIYAYTSKWSGFERV